MAGRDGRGLAVLLVAMLAALPVAGAQPLRPAEEPPADFTGRQYIDSAGCVFLRDGKLWTARLGRDGAPVCGYPPTPIPRAPDTERPADAAPPPMDGMGRIEAELVTTLAAGLQPGDLVDPAAPPASVAEAAGGEVDVAQVMAAAVAASPGIARAATAEAGPPNARLCALLGIAPGMPDRALGGDPTGGFCAGAAAAGPLPRVAQAESAAKSAASGDAGGRAALAPRPVAAKAPVAGARGAATTRADAARSSSGGRRAAPPSAEGLIPAGTRFLRIGAYPDAAAAEAALRRVAGLGLPVARSRRGDADTRTILAGPFYSRQAVVRAHDRLTRAGFRGLLPMR